mmetsp:Transcript_3548/g.4269  ORF Transcript_3548/g.4269 Transcript_3548/m.4269 type:complete len:236 (-) Transcript_3548:2180-2887(-)
MANSGVSYRLLFDGSYVAIFVISTTALLLCTFFYETVSLVMLSVSILAIAVLGWRCVQSTSRIQKRFDLAISLFIYSVILVALLDQGICNIFGKGCPFEYDAEKEEPLLILIVSFALCLIFNSLSVFYAAQLMLSEDDGDMASRHEVKPDLKLPVVTMGKVKNVFQQSECQICQIDFVTTASVMCLPCGHIFHDNCLNKWYKRSNLCPICRHNVFEPNSERSLEAENRHGQMTIV